MHIEEIKQEIDETFKMHKNNRLYAFFLNIGYVKGLNRARAITELEFIDLLDYIQERE